MAPAFVMAVWVIMRAFDALDVLPLPNLNLARTIASINGE